MASIRKHPLLVYFLLAFAITWMGSTLYTFTLPRSGPLLPAWLNLPGVLLWYFGPFLAALIATRLTRQPGGIRNLLQRFLIWRASWQAVAFIFLYPPALHLAVVYLDRLLGGPAPVFFQADGVPAGNAWQVLLMLVLYHTLIRGIGEETGWRGFAQPLMQGRWGALRGSLGLGLIWALWHFHPANFPGLLSIAGVFIFLNITLTAVIFTWVLNHTRGSLLYAALFHMTLNVTEFIVPIGIVQASYSRSILQVVLICLTIAALILISGSQLGVKDRQT